MTDKKNKHIWYFGVEIYDNILLDQWTIFIYLCRSDYLITDSINMATVVKQYSILLWTVSINRDIKQHYICIIILSINRVRFDQVVQLSTKTKFDVGKFHHPVNNY